MAQKLVNIQTKMPAELKDKAEKGAIQAGFRTLQDAFYFFASSLANSNIRPILMSDTLTPRERYIKELEADAIQAERELSSGEYKTIKVANSVEELMKQIREEADTNDTI